MGIAGKLYGKVMDPILTWGEPYYERTMAPRWRPEPATITIWPKYREPSDIVLEAGACTGKTTLFLSDFSRKVYAFEPIEKNFARLKKMTKHYKNVQCFNPGLGDKSETVARKGTVSYSAAFAMTGDTKMGKMVAIDDLQLDPAPNVFWLDLEGYELKALKGGRKALSNARVVGVEVHPDPQTGTNQHEIEDSLKYLGFKTTAEKSGAIWTPSGEWKWVPDGYEEIWVVGTR